MLPESELDPDSDPELVELSPPVELLFAAVVSVDVLVLVLGSIVSITASPQAEPSVNASSAIPYFMIFPSLWQDTLTSAAWRLVAVQDVCNARISASL